MSRFDSTDGDDFISPARDGDLEIYVVSADYSKWADVRCRKGGLYAPLADENVGASAQVLWKVHLGVPMGRSGHWLKPCHFHS